MLLDAGQLGLLIDASACLELANGGLGLGVDGISEAAEGVCIRIVEETAFLEQKRGVGLASNLEKTVALVAEDGANP